MIAEAKSASMQTPASQKGTRPPQMSSTLHRLSTSSILALTRQKRSESLSFLGLCMLCRASLCFAKLQLVLSYGRLLPSRRPEKMAVGLLGGTEVQEPPEAGRIRQGSFPR